MTTIRGSAAAVTGAASGIGRALALELAARGSISRWPIATRRLADGGREINRTHRKVTAHRVDVSEPQQIADFAQAATSTHPGLTSSSTMPASPCSASSNEIDQAQMDWLMNINSGRRASNAALSCRIWRASAKAHIVNLSSIFGIIAPPGQTAYAGEISRCAAFPKFGHELQMAASPIRLRVHPGGVSTNIVRNSRAGTGRHRQ